MSDTLKPEESSAVEDAPAHAPRSDLPQSPASRPGGSPCRDEIDEWVDASLERGPVKNYMDRCPYCMGEWHGLQNSKYCQGSHLKPKGFNEIRKQSLDSNGDTPCDS